MSARLIGFFSLECDSKFRRVLEELNVSRGGFINRDEFVETALKSQVIFVNSFRRLHFQKSIENFFEKLNQYPEIYRDVLCNFL